MTGPHVIVHRDASGHTRAHLGEVRDYAPGVLTDFPALAVEAREACTSRPGRSAAS